MSIHVHIACVLRLVPQLCEILCMTVAKQASLSMVILQVRILA